MQGALELFLPARSVLSGRARRRLMRMDGEVVILIADF